MVDKRKKKAGQKSHRKFKHFRVGVLHGKRVDIRG
jgi:hypothetical protein